MVKPGFIYAVPVNEQVTIPAVAAVAAPEQHGLASVAARRAPSNKIKRRWRRRIVVMTGTSQQVVVISLP
jgi:hypothetical protein